MKKITVILLACMMMVAAVLTGCGGSSGASAQTNTFSGKKSTAPIEEAAAATPVNFAGGIQEYVLYGTYNSQYFSIDGTCSKKIIDSVENMTYITRDLKSGEQIDLSAVPVSMKIHRANELKGDCSWLKTNTDWQELYKTLMEQNPDKADEYLANVHALYDMSVAEVAYVDKDAKAYGRYQLLYTMDGTTMKCREIDEIGEDYKPVFNEQQPEIEFEIQFLADAMKISRNGSSVVLFPDQKWRETQGDLEYYNLNGAVAKDEDAYNGIADVSLSWETGKAESIGICMIRFTDGSYSSPLDTTAVIERPNTAVVKWGKRMMADGSVQEKEEELRLKFINGGGLLDPYLVLLDDAGNTYPYQCWYADYTENKAADNLGDDVVADDLSNDELGKIVANQETVVQSIQEGFSGSEIEADVDEQSGTVRFDSNVLFAVDSAEIGEEGKASLDEFLNVYIPIIKEKAESGIIANIQIDGHTDTSGDHEYNQKLSEERAKAVADYVTEQYPDLAQYVTAKGFSYDKPIFAEDGTVDMDASRRVEFRFIMNVSE